jgi:hypothetical protein
LQEKEIQELETSRMKLLKVIDEKKFDDITATQSPGTNAQTTATTSHQGADNKSDSKTSPENSKSAPTRIFKVMNENTQVK